MVQLAGKAEFRAASALALTVASELNGIADNLAMSTREALYDTDDVLRAIDTSLEELQSTVDTYSKQLQTKFYE